MSRYVPTDHRERRKLLWNLAQKIEIAEGGCWNWKGHVSKYGYGQYTTGGRSRPVSIRSHVLVYENLIGSVPDGLQLDHLCRNRKCVNPLHLDEVTSRENTLRGDGLAAQNAKKIRCVRGHPLYGDNVYSHPNRNNRTCRTCQRAHEKAYKDKIRKGKTVAYLAALLKPNA